LAGIKSLSGEGIYECGDLHFFGLDLGRDDLEDGKQLVFISPAMPLNSPATFRELYGDFDLCLEAADLGLGERCGLVGDRGWCCGVSPQGLVPSLLLLLAYSTTSVC